MYSVLERLCPWINVILYLREDRDLRSCGANKG